MELRVFRSKTDVFDDTWIWRRGGGTGEGEGDIRITPVFLASSTWRLWLF